MQLANIVNVESSVGVILASKLVVIISPQPSVISTVYVVLTVGENIGFGIEILLTPVFGDHE